ncbi:MAG: hypothetical protein J5756_06610 [Clostridia bacterium]|nr:hypothetical protein [Clostridia bacterium]
MINKSWKKLLSVLLSVAMLLSLMPGIGLIAYADTDYPLWVGETQVTGANAADTAAHPTWSYDADTNTLKLNGFTYTGPGYQYLKDDFDDIRAGIYYSDSAKALTIEFSDNNAVSASNSGVPVSGMGNTAAGIRSEGDLILCAPNGGTLDINATGTQAVGIWAPNVTVNSGAPTVNVNATDGIGSYCVMVDDTFTVNGEAEVQLNDTTTNLAWGCPFGILAIHAVFNGGWTYVSMTDSQAVGINCDNIRHFDPMTGEDVIDEYGSFEMNGGYLSSTSPEVAINVNNDTGFKLAAGTTMKYGDLVTITTYTGDLADAYDAIREIEDINGQIVQNAAKYVTLSVPAHTHSFTYSASGAVVAAACSAGCPAGYDDANKPALTIVAPTLTTCGGTGSASATLDGLADFNSATGLSVSADNIAYYNTKLEGTQLVKDGAALAAAPTGAGTYWAEIVVEGATASVTYTISPMALTITGATATNRAYDKDSTAVTISAVTFKDNNNQPVALTLGENGDYTVTGEMADANAGDNKEVTVTVTLKNGNYSLATNTTVTTVNISKAAPGYTVPTDVEATYGDTISSVTLPDGWTWEDDPTTSVGNVGSWQFPATFTPGDTANYEIVEHVQVTVTVNKAASAAATVAANEWTFDGATKPLVTVTGAPAGGTMAYALGTETAAGVFGDAIPEASDPDTYYVWYKVVGDGNHNDTEPVCVTVVVAHDEELDAVIAAINAIGPVTEVDFAQKAKIDAAREGYEALTAAQKLLVTNYTDLTTAEADYKALFVYSASTQITVSGTERIGETLTATATDIPAFITDSVIRWYNEDGDLLGTGATYVIPESQIGKTIRAELYSAEAEDSVYSDYTGAVDKGIIKGYKLPTAAAIMYPQTLAEATLTGGDTGAVEGVWAWVLADEKPTSEQNGALYALTFTPTGEYAALYEVINAKLAITVNPAPFEPKTVEDPVTGLELEAEFAQGIEITLTDIPYTQSAYLALLRASKKDASPLGKLMLLKTIDFTVNGAAVDEAYKGTVTIKSYVGENLAGREYSVWFFVDGAPVNYVGTVNADGVLVIDGVTL